MNILWLSHNIPYPPKTGVLQRNYNLLKQASKIGNIYLVAVYQRGILPIKYDFTEVKRELGNFCKHIEIVDLPIDSSKTVLFWTILKSIFTVDPFTINWLKSGKMRNIIRRTASKAEFDIIHFDTISLAEYFNDVGKAPKILNHHNMESHLLMRRSIIEKNILKKIYYKMEGHKLKYYEKSHCGKFDVNFTVSEDDKQLLQSLIPGKRIEVVPNGVDIEYFRRGEIEPVPRSIIFAGGMNWYPNLDAIVYFCHEVWPLLKREYPDISFTVVGAHPPSAVLEMAEKDPSIKVTGFVDDVRHYFSCSEIYVCPMRDGGGTRLKILDTLSMETALVSTTMGCEGIDVVPEKNVLIADNPTQFVNQISRIFEDVTLRRKLGAEGRKLVAGRYAWEVIGSKLKDIYSDLVKMKN